MRCFGTHHQYRYKENCRLTMRSVLVYNNDVLAGVLTENSDMKYVFSYDDAYFNDDSQPSVSITLSKKQKTHESDKLFAFFTNMLPEGVNRQVLCRKNKIDENDFFGMLEAVKGWDFIGSVCIK